MPLLLQFSIALFTGMVAATFVPPIRRSIPRPVEVLLWVALITACAIGLSSVTSENARNLTTSVVWATDQVINTILGLLLGGVGAWISAHRFLIATWLIVVAGGDLFALMLLRSIRRARVGQPRVRLGEWMEMPVPVASTPAIGRASSAPLLAVDRRLAAATMLLVAAVFSRTVDMSIWIHNVLLPREARRLAHAADAGRVGSRARLESLRDAAAHLQFAARAWYSAAGEPAVRGLAGGLAVNANHANRSARATRRGLRAQAFVPDQVIDIQALLSAQSIGWYGPLTAGPTQPPRGEHDAAEPPQTDRLAS